MALYGGWENWETWQMAMILDMNEGLDDFLREKIDENQIYDFDAQRMIRETSKLLEDYVEEDLPEIRPPWDGFLRSAFEKVNWEELGERFLKEEKLLTREGRKPKGPREWSPRGE